MAKPSHTDLICIVCPKGCRLHVEQAGSRLTVSGNSCPRGEQYAREELTHPMRTLTTTVRVTGGLYPRLPVKSRGGLPRERLMEAMARLDRVQVQAPVHVGDVIVADILGTGVDIVATRDM